MKVSWKPPYYNPYKEVVYWGTTCCNHWLFFADFTFSLTQEVLGPKVLVVIVVSLTC